MRLVRSEILALAGGRRNARKNSPNANKILLLREMIKHNTSGPSPFRHLHPSLGHNRFQIIFLKLPFHSSQQEWRRDGIHSHKPRGHKQLALPQTKPLLHRLLKLLLQVPERDCHPSQCFLGQYVARCCELQAYAY